MSESKPELVAIPAVEGYVFVQKPVDPLTELFVRVTALEEKLKRMERELLRPESDR